MRFNLFTGRRLQLKYLTLITLAMFIPTLIVGSCLYYFIFTVMAEQLAIPESIAANLMPALKKINIMLAVGLVPFFVLLFSWGLILSHRFCGPLKRVEEDLEKILKGDFCIRFNVRENDDIKGIVDKLNKLLDNLCPKRSDNDSTPHSYNR